MEAQNKQTMIMNSNFFKIPVEEFEEYIKTEPSKEKAEILDYLTNYSHLHSLQELREIRYELHRAYKKCSFELIKIYLNEKIENESTGLVFKIDKTNQTASLFQFNSNNDEIIIPRTFKYESTEYLITSISICHTKTLKFVEDSAVTTIYANSFHISHIQEIYFPKSLIDLKKGWNNKMYDLTKIIVSPLNDKFIFKDENILLGKTDHNNDDFDILIFARRDIKEILIPSNIKIISSGAFKDCSCLRKIEYQENSNLMTIESKAFAYSCVKEFYIPRYLNYLGRGWCKDMRYLSKIIVSPLNDNFIFNDDKFLFGKSNINNDDFDVLLFVNRDIEEIIIPSNIKIISSYSFQYSKIKQIIIPTQVTKICEYAFSYCKNLTKIEIPPESNLQTIEKWAFTGTNIKQIYIPSKVSKICKCTFFGCFNLQKVEISTNSNLKEIETNAFLRSNIEEINFPKTVDVMKRWCCGTSKLSNIKISPLNDQLVLKDDNYLLGKTDKSKNEFDIFEFASRNALKISIPLGVKIISSCAFQRSRIREVYISSHVKSICNVAFSECKYLEKVEIPIDSNLEIIGCHAFAMSGIKQIFIPSKVTKICEYAFSECQDLTKVEILENSNLQIIESNAFEKSHINQILIPSKISRIFKCSFYCCSNLQKVEIQENSNLQAIESKAFIVSKIKELYFPKYLNVLEKGWFEDMRYLSKIIVSPLNDNFIFIDDKFLFGKSNINNDDFDVLLFVNRDIEEIIIPTNIKIISSYSFQYSKIKQIIIPTQVTKICEYAFSYCKNLTKIEIPPESNLQTIEEYAFFRSNINYICIPSKVSTICESAFNDCANLTKVEIPINLHIIEPGAFAHSNIKEISIPSKVSEIGKSAFFYCENLTKVEIPANSNLQIIDIETFAKTSIKDIYIPSNVLQICDHAFKMCKNLQIIEISEESKLESFPSSVFSECQYIIVMIPTALKKLINIVDKK